MAILPVKYGNIWPTWRECNHHGQDVVVIFDSPYFQRFADVRRRPCVEASSKLPLVPLSELSEAEYNRLVEPAAANGEEPEDFECWPAPNGNAIAENSQGACSNPDNDTERSDPIESKSLQT